MTAAPPLAGRRRRLHFRIFRGIGLGFVSALAAWALTAAPFIRGIEDWVLDGWFFYRGARPTDAKIVLIGLDNESLHQLKKPLPWISPELALVVRHVLDGGAAAVGLDVLVPEDKSDEPEIARVDGRGEGISLGQLVLRSGRIVLPVRGDGDGGALLPVKQWWQPKRLLRRDKTDFGFVDLDEDGDQIVRRQSLLLGSGDDATPHLALALYARSRGEPVDWHAASGVPRVGGQDVPLDAQGRLRINFVGSPEAIFPVVPFHAALDAARAGRPLPADVRGAVVLIGATARTLQDHHATPYANHYARYEATPAPGLMAGVELHANLLATLHDRAFITTPWWLAPVPLLMIVGVLLGAIFARLSLEAGFVVAVLHHFAWKLTAFLAFARGNYRIEVVAMLLLGALCYGATFAARWRVLRRMFGVVKSEAVARALEADPHRLDPGGEEREVTVLFADIRRFTDFSEKHTAAEVVTLLNAYFAVAAPALEAAGGTIMTTWAMASWSYLARRPISATTRCGPCAPPRRWCRPYTPAARAGRRWTGPGHGPAMEACASASAFIPAR